MHDSLAGRRILVTGATGFLGTAVARHLVEQQAIVTALVRGKPHDSEFVRTRLFEKVTVVGGLIEDAVRLRQILAIHAIDGIVQCAADSTTAATFALTHAVLKSAATCERKPTVAVPLRMEQKSSSIRFQSFPNARLDVAFVRLPDLFGPGDLNMNHWPAGLFLRAARDEAMLPPPRDGGVIDVDQAAAALVGMGLKTPAELSPMGRWHEVPAPMSKRELFRAVREQSTEVRATLLWYRAHAAQLGDRMSLRAAA